MISPFQGLAFRIKFQLNYHVFSGIVLGPHFSDFSSFYPKKGDFGTPVGPAGPKMAKKIGQLAQK